jgi:lycopene beta-cyclase
MSQHKYDIIFAGAGLSALSMATCMVQLPFFSEKKILLIDRDSKEKNDRTWCFWASPDELARMPPVIARSWPAMDFFSPQFSARLNAGDYAYHMVRGADFYDWAKKILANHHNVEWLQTDIFEIDAAAGTVKTSKGYFTGEWVLNSALTPFSLLPNLKKDRFATPLTAISQIQSEGYIYLLQHFKGWIIRTSEPSFDPGTVTLMDFRLAQSGDTRFVYVLPLSPTEALVEFTVFSPELLADDDYEAALQHYIRDFLKIEQYDVVETEFGVIPMTDYPFPQMKSGHLIAIGTAGGFVKGSSGYAFKRTQRRAAAFTAAWAQTGRPDTSILKSPGRFRIYDTIFLRALADGLVPAHLVFSSFFKNLTGQSVFQFLDEDSNFLADFRALNAVPLLPFMRAAIRQRSRLLHV